MFWDNLYELCQKNGTSPSKLVKELGISAGSVTKWKNGSMPSKNTVQKLAAYFGVTVGYFYVEHTEAFNTVAELTAHDRALLASYHAHPELQVAVDRLLGIEKTDRVYLYTAAYSDDKRLDEIVGMSREQLEKIQDAPETDDTLM